MPDSDKQDGSAADAGEPGSSSGGGLWGAIRALFEDQSDTSLRAQLEEAIDEHEDEAARSTEARGADDLSPLEVTMLRNLLHYSEHSADDMAVPRGEIIAIEAGASWDDLVARFAQNGISRLPVYRTQLDDVIGMMHIKDVFPYLALGTPPPADWTQLMRQPLYVPQTRSALDVLAEMRMKRTHLAIVLDEFSGTEGLITIEDLVEAIVGEIEDEHDEEPVELITPNADGSWDCDARAELDDVARRVGDPRLADVREPVDTIGGLTFVLAEAVPPPRSMLDHPSGWRIEVMAGNATHITRLRLHPPAAG